MHLEPSTEELEHSSNFFQYFPNCFQFGLDSQCFVSVMREGTCGHVSTFSAILAAQIISAAGLFSTMEPDNSW